MLKWEVPACGTRGLHDGILLYYMSLSVNLHLLPLNEKVDFSWPLSNIASLLLEASF